MVDIHGSISPGSGSLLTKNVTEERSATGSIANLSLSSLFSALDAVPAAAAAVRRGPADPTLNRSWPQSVSTGGIPGPVAWARLVFSAGLIALSSPPVTLWSANGGWSSHGY